MTEFQKILFQVDLSESSEKILLYVRMVAKKFDAKKRAAAPPLMSLTWLSTAITSPSHKGPRRLWPGYIQKNLSFQ